MDGCHEIYEGTHLDEELKKVSFYSITIANPVEAAETGKKGKVKIKCKIQRETFDQNIQSTFSPMSTLVF